jgi:hypothetical protein
MYKIIKNILSSYECEFIFSEFEKVEKEKDHQVKESDILFSWEISDKFCEKFKPLVEDFYSTKLNTVLGYTRKSFKGQTLTKHKDVTELVMCVSIKQSDINVNPLYIYIDGEKIEVILEQGDGVIFEGSKIYHEREPLISDWILGMYLGYERIKKLI